MILEGLTSAQMDRLLDRLGYHLMPSKGRQRVFENEEFDAVQLLPAADTEPYARIERLMTLRHIAVARGIVDEATFERLLNEVRQETREPLAKAS